MNDGAWTWLTHYVPENWRLFFAEIKDSEFHLSLPSWYRYAKSLMSTYFVHPKGEDELSFFKSCHLTSFCPRKFTYIVEIFGLSHFNGIVAARHAAGAQTSFFWFRPPAKAEGILENWRRFWLASGISVWNFQSLRSAKVEKLRQEW